WQDDWNNTECVEDLKRSLHTFKGGARLAGLTDIGDLSHEFESVLIEMGSDAEIDQNFFRQMNSFQDGLHTLVARAQAQLAGATVSTDEAPEIYVPVPPTEAHLPSPENTQDSVEAFVDEAFDNKISSDETRELAIEQ